MNQKLEGPVLTRAEIVLTLAGLMLGVLMSALDNTVVGTAMPKLIRDLNGLNLYSWPFTIYLLTSTLAIPVFGRLADQVGRRTVFLAGLIEFILASVLCGLSPSMVAFIAFRGLQGLGGGILVSNAFALAGEISTPQRRGAYMGMIGAMFGIAGLLGPSIGGLLADGPGWRWAFYINLPLGIAALAVLVFGLRHVKEERSRVEFDPWGVSLFVLTVAPLLLALSWGGRDYPWTDPVILGLFGASLLCLVGFLWVERRSAHPLLPGWLFRKADFNRAAAGVFLGNAVFFGAVLFLPLWIQEVLGSSASASGLALTPLVVTYSLASVLAGQVFRKLKSLGRFAFVAGLVALAGCAALTLIGPSAGTLPLIAAMVAIGLGLGAMTPVFSVAAQNSVEPRFIGLATATNNFFRNLGAAVGAAVTGSVFLQRLHEGLGRVDWGSLPDAVRQTLENPKVLMNPSALRAVGQQVPEASQDAFRRLMGQIDGQLAAAIGAVFVVMAVVALVLLPVVGFIRGLRRGG